MAKRKTETPVSVRLTPEQAKNLKDLSTKLDIPTGKIIKWAVDGLLKKVEEDGGEMRLPFRL